MKSSDKENLLRRARKLAQQNIALIKELETITVVPKAEKQDLTKPSTLTKLPPVKDPWEQLAEDLKKLTNEPGQMTALADYLGVPLASVSRWLAGKREPGGKITLRMLRWVQEQKEK